MLRNRSRQPDVTNVKLTGMYRNTANQDQLSVAFVVKITGPKTAPPCPDVLPAWPLGQLQSIAVTDLAL